MKKSSKIILGIAGLVIVGGSVGLGAGLKQISKDRLEQDIVVDSNVNELVINVDNSNEFYFSIEQNSSNSVRIEDEFLPSQIELKKNQKENTLTLDFEDHKHTNSLEFLSSHQSTNLYLSIPESIESLKLVSSSNIVTQYSISDLTIDQIALDTVNSSFFLYESEAKTIDLVTQKGTVSLDGIVVEENVNIKSKSAPVALNDIQASQQVKVDAEKGLIHTNDVSAKNLLLTNKYDDITLENIKGAIDATSTNGSLYFATKHLTDDIKLETEFGNIVALFFDKTKENATITTTNSYDDILLFNKSITEFKGDSSEQKMELLSTKGFIRTYDVIPTMPDGDSDEWEIEVDRFEIDGTYENKLENDYIDFYSIYYDSEVFHNPDYSFDFHY